MRALGPALSVDRRFDRPGEPSCCTTPRKQPRSSKARRLAEAKRHAVLPAAAGTGPECDRRSSCDCREIGARRILDRVDPGQDHRVVGRAEGACDGEETAACDAPSRPLVISVVPTDVEKQGYSAAWVVSRSASRALRLATTCAGVSFDGLEGPAVAPPLVLIWSWAWSSLSSACPSRSRPRSSGS